MPVAALNERDLALVDASALIYKTISFRNCARTSAYIKLFTFAQFSALAITYRVCQPVLGEKS